MPFLNEDVGSLPHTAILSVFVRLRKVSTTHSLVSNPRTLEIDLTSIHVCHFLWKKVQVSDVKVFFGLVKLKLRFAGLVQLQGKNACYADHFCSGTVGLVAGHFVQDHYPLKKPLWTVVFWWFSPWFFALPFCHADFALQCISLCYALSGLKCHFLIGKIHKHGIFGMFTHFLNLLALACHLDILYWLPCCSTLLLFWLYPSSWAWVLFPEWEDFARSLKVQLLTLLLLFWRSLTSRFQCIVPKLLAKGLPCLFGKIGEELHLCSASFYCVYYSADFLVSAYCFVPQTCYLLQVKGFDLHYLSGRFERQFFVSGGEDFLSWTSIPVAPVAACSLLLTPPHVA